MVVVVVEESVVCSWKATTTSFHSRHTKTFSINQTKPFFEKYASKMQIMVQVVVLVFLYIVAGSVYEGRYKKDDRPSS